LKAYFSFFGAEPVVVLIPNLGQPSLGFHN
jgi:hypothetical protein